MTSSSRPETRSTAASPSTGLPAHLRRSLEAPIAALRASIEDLEHEFEDGDERGRRLHRAGELVENLRTCVEALVDLAGDSATSTPLPCTLEELGRSALALCPARIAGQVELALESGALRFETDGPALTRSLSYLVQAHVGPEDEALLHGRAGDGEICFCLVAPASGSEHGSPGNIGQELLLVAATQDVARLGGRVDIEPATGDTQKVTVRLPLGKRVGGGHRS